MTKRSPVQPSPPSAVGTGSSDAEITVGHRARANPRSKNVPPTVRANILGCQIDRVDMPTAVARIERAIQERGFIQHVAINAAKITALRRDPALREIVAGAELVTADGAAIVWASRLLRDPLPSRVTGIDLMHELLARARVTGYRVYILGAERSVLDVAIRRLGEHYPGLILVGYRDGYFHPTQDEEVAREIAAAVPDILMVAISSPRKEYFLAQHGRSLGIPFVMGIGGAVDIVAGVTHRAPRLVQRLGFEWLYRLAQEPRRLARRYAVSNTYFVALLAREVLFSLWRSMRS